ncbi:MAG: SDR family oxidoreductase [Candidatus Woesearchaeota archaeon]
MKQKVIFITGASSGIGYATAQLFAKKGWRVIATMRDISQAPPFPKNVTILALDVTKPDTIKNAVAKVMRTHKRIDVLVNNAGYGLFGELTDISEEKIARQLATNVQGLILITKAVLPIMKTQKSGVIVNISSIIGRIAFPFSSLYTSSKWAVEGFSESLFYEAGQQGIRVKIVEPGPVKTDFFSRSLDMALPKNLSAKQKRMLEQSENMTKNASSPEQIAKVIHKAATTSSKKLRYPAGAMSRIALFFEPFIPTRIRMWLIRTFM